MLCAESLFNHLFQRLDVGIIISFELRVNVRLGLCCFGRCGLCLKGVDLGKQLIALCDNGIRICGVIRYAYLVCDAVKTLKILIDLAEQIHAVRVIVGKLFALMHQIGNEYQGCDIRADQKDDQYRDRNQHFQTYTDVS